MDELNYFSETDKNDVAYGVCRQVTAGIGAGVGALASGGLGAVAGFSAGLIMGVKLCKIIAPALKHKIFAEQKAINNDELSQVLKTIRRLDPMIGKNEALRRFAEIRTEIAQRPWLYKQV